VVGEECELVFAAFEVPEVMQVAVGKDDEAAILRLGVFTDLLFSQEWAFVLGLGFEEIARINPILDPSV